MSKTSGNCSSVVGISVVCMVIIAFLLACSPGGGGPGRPGSRKSGSWQECPVELPGNSGRVVFRVRNFQQTEIRFETGRHQNLTKPLWNALAKKEGCINVYWYRQERGRGPFVLLRDRGKECLVDLNRGVTRLIQCVPDGRVFAGDISQDNKSCKMNYGTDSRGAISNLSVIICGRQAEDITPYFDPAAGAYMGKIVDKKGRACFVSAKEIPEEKIAARSTVRKGFVRKTTTTRAYKTSYGQPVDRVKTAVKLLSYFDDERCVNAIVDVFEDKKRPKEIRIVAINSLDKDIHKQLTPKLIAVLKEENNPKVAYEINKTLKRLTGFTVKFPRRGATREDITNLALEWEELSSDLKTADPLELIAIQLKDPNQFNRQKAVGKLSKINDARAVPLLEIALRDKSRDVSSSALSALCRFKGERIIEILRQVALEHQYAYVREEALNHLLKLLDEEDSEALLKQLVEDADWEVKTAAAGYLFKRGDRSAVPVLVGALDSKDFNARSSVIFLFVDGALPEAKDKIRGIFEDSSEDMTLRIQCAKGLALGGDYSGMKFLIRAVRNSESGVSNSANGSLGQIANRSIRLLLESDQESRDRVSNVWVDWWAKNKNKSRDVWLAEGFKRRAYFIEDVNDRKSIPNLIRALSDSEGYIATNAAYCLRKLTGQDFGFTTWPKDKKKAAIEKWRKWWQSQQE